MPRPRCFCNIAEVFVMFSQDCLTEFPQFSCADAFRKGIQHHPPPSPSRHWPHQINLPRRLWVIAEVLGLFSEHFRIRLYHFLGHMHFAGKFALHRRRGIRVIRLRSPSGFCAFSFFTGGFACFRPHRKRTRPLDSRKILGKHWACWARRPVSAASGALTAK